MLETQTNPIRIIAASNQNQDKITYLKADPQNQNIFLTNCGEKLDELKVWTSAEVDQVFNFRGSGEIVHDGHAVFVVSSNTGSSKRMTRLVGFSKGMIKRISLVRLEILDCYQLEMDDGGEEITCGYFSDNGINFVIGTNYGSIFIGSMKSLKNDKAVIRTCKIRNIGKSK